MFFEIQVMLLQIISSPKYDIFYRLRDYDVHLITSR